MGKDYLACAGGSNDYVDHLLDVEPPDAVRTKLNNKEDVDNGNDGDDFKVTLDWNRSYDKNSEIYYHLHYTYYKLGL